MNIQAAKTKLAAIPVSCNKDCAAGCPLLAHVKDGKIIKITNNPAGTVHMQGCSKGFQAMQAAYSPDRLLKPMIRSGSRGSNNFKAAADHAGAINMLTSTKPTEPCMGSRTHSVLVEVSLPPDLR